MWTVFVGVAHDHGQPSAGRWLLSSLDTTHLTIGSLAEVRVGGRPDDHT